MKQNLSQRDLEAKFIKMGITNFTQPYICKVEAGKKLYAAELIAYARGLGMNACYLIKALEEFMAQEAEE